MKLTFVLLTVAIMQVSARSYAQKITIDQKSASLETVLKQIRAQSGYDFLYDAQIINKAKTVDIKVKNASIEEALKVCLDGQSLIYTIDEHTVVIKAETKSLLDKFTDKVKALSDDAKQVLMPSIVVGKVTNYRGEPLAGANVIIKRTKLGTTTGLDGSYVLKIAEVNDTLLFSYIGYKTLTVPIKKRVTVNVQLEEAMSGLDEVVVQAYGQTTQRLTTGNVGRVTAAEIGKQIVHDPLLALEGKVAGVEITPQTGYDRGPVKVVIRGRSSINGNFTSDPLYIIDGVPQTVLDLRPQRANEIKGDFSPGLGDPRLSASGGTSPLAGYNPGDIASVEILKDADATAIYGSRGANGVILITTKKGSPSKGDFSINISQGVTRAIGEWAMLNTQQYLDMRREAFKNDGIKPTPANAPDLFIWDQNRYTDWQKYSYGGTGNWTQIGTSLSGGNAQTTYRIAGNYSQSTDITTLKGKNPGGSLSSSLVTHSANQRFTLSLTTNYSFYLANQIGVSGFGDAAPNAPPALDNQGNLNFAEYDAAKVAFPFSQLLVSYKAKTYTLNSSLNLSYAIAKGLTARANIGYNNVQKEQENYIPIASIDPHPPGGDPNRSGQALLESAHTNNVIFEPQLEYNGILSKGSINFLLGGTYQANTTGYLRGWGVGFTDDADLHNLGAAPTMTVSNGTGQYKYTGVFARIGYNWESKYIINLNGRRDGSSRFGVDNRFGNFGSVGAAYIVSEEKWVRNILPKALSTIKLRGSYGTTGSDGVGDYQYLTQWGVLSSGSLIPKYDGENTLVSMLHANPDFHWQVNKKLEGALDLGFADDRINVEAAYYRNRCNNQLIQFPLADLTGFSVVTANSPANVQNDGWEFSINAFIINGKHFRWNSNFNVGINHNKLVSYPNFELSPYYTTMRIGGALGDVYLLQFTGVDPQTGKYTYLDANHDGKITGSTVGVPPGTGADDLVAIVNTTPKYSGGMTQQFSYNNISVSLGFTFRKGIGQNALANTALNSSLKNMSLYAYENRWQKPGDITSVARLTVKPDDSDGNFTSSTGYYTDASFIRLQNVHLSYSLTPALAHKLGLKTLSVNASAQNIFVITKYKGLDPEYATFGSLPPTRAITGGLSATF